MGHRRSMRTQRGSRALVWADPLSLGLTARERQPNMISCHNHGFAQAGSSTLPAAHPTPQLARKAAGGPPFHFLCRPLGEDPSWPHLQHLPVELGYQRTQVQERGCSHTTSPTASWCCSRLLALRALFLG